jgi:2-methylcitrate dehydratase PrpD
MADIYEIHRYQNDSFQYIVATTNKHSEEHVKQDVDHFNSILSNEMKSQCIKYVFAIGSQKGTSKKNNKYKDERNTEHSI